MKDGEVTIRRIEEEKRINGLEGELESNRYVCIVRKIRPRKILWAHKKL